MEEPGATRGDLKLRAPCSGTPGPATPAPRPTPGHTPLPPAALCPISQVAGLLLDPKPTPLLSLKLRKTVWCPGTGWAWESD